MTQKKNKFQEYVVGFAFTQDLQQVLLIEKNKPEWQKGKKNGIGGKVENGEKSYEAMVREFEEEVGLKTKSEDWKCVLYLSAPDEAVYVYCSAFDRNFLDRYKKMEEEQPSMSHVGSIHLYDHLNWYVPNLKWIVPFCIRSFEDKSMIYPVFVRYSENAK